MFVSTQMQVASTNSRVSPRRAGSDDAQNFEIRRLFDKAPEDRRQGQFARRLRPAQTRLRDSDADARLSPGRPPVPGKSVPFSSLPHSSLPKTAEFWALLGAVAPEPVASARDGGTASTAGEPTLDELLARVIATH